MTNNKSSTKRAALELIEAEKQRRIDLKMASGEAVQGPPLILVRGVKDAALLPRKRRWWSEMRTAARCIAF